MTAAQSIAWLLMPVAVWLALIITGTIIETGRGRT
jgi:hypothetical protein